MRISCFAVILCVALGTSIQHCDGSLHRNNKTHVEIENFEPQGNFTRLKERYRRLVPYMAYYLVGNNVENQPPRTDKYEKIRDRIIPRKPQFNIRPSSDPRERNRQQYTKQTEKFLPSVQYNPKDVGPNKAYFTPIRYGMKLNQRDYSPFSPNQNTRPVHSRPTLGNIVSETKLYKTEAPRKLQTLPKMVNYLPFRQTVKTPPSTIDDYFLDYETQSLGNLQPTSYDYEQPYEEFESFRYATPAPDRVNVFKPPISRPNDLNNQPLKVPVSELDHIVKTLQLSNQLPEMLNKDNIDSSIRTLVEILNILHNARSRQPQLQHQITNPKLKSKPPDYGFHEDSPRPQVLETNYYVTPNVIDRPPEIAKELVNFQTQHIPNDLKIQNSNLKSDKVTQYYHPEELEIDNRYKETFSQIAPQENIENQPYKVNLHSENTLENDRFRYPINTEKPTITNNYPVVNNVPKDNTQNIPPSLKYGATRGKPHVDYPAYSTIPLTNFNCKQQRYKGFFGDPATRCQVWHYCDLNGGKSSFLCPNGTIFNQVALTCDWWFNVKCESTTQLYVLNERLYKYILPVMPKFPEDFTGPEVDRYLEQKFKEIEAKLQEKKLKKEQEEKDKTQESIKDEMLSENSSE
ncbi:uncharacterized protein LOC122500160 [Leptopilina heterotoma]|uniref:uncharacterized protein LOC122500160 n=1 Tax=Leptopilina heterotoma TaxID=63436 RepID=UPI001CA83869|nr:uncharacterized protein LOC122500160 [Leptopilina heterotoma]